MTFPSTLNPWYVVQRLRTAPLDLDVWMPPDYYTSADDADDEDGQMFTTDEHKAMIFMSLHQASRVAASEGAQIRVLTTKEEAEEFGRT